MRSSFWGTPAVISSHPGPGGDSRGRGEGGRGRAGGSALRVVPASRKRGAHASPHGGVPVSLGTYYGPALCWVQPVAARACWSPPAQGGRRGGGDPRGGTPEEDTEQVAAGRAFQAEVQPEPRVWGRRTGGGAWLSGRNGRRKWDAGRGGSGGLVGPGMGALGSPPWPQSQSGHHGQVSGQL